MKNDLATQSVALGLMLAVGCSHAGYLRDTQGDVVRNNYGDCWRTGYWQAQDSIGACDGLQAKEPGNSRDDVPVVRSGSAQQVKTIQRVTLDSETYFEFDSARLKPAAKGKLDELVKSIDNSKGFEKITITGHADRIGSREYNQRLSEQRAGSVRQYLVEQINQPDKIFSSGQGETQPVVKCEQKQGDNLIRCLAPNRRVDIDLEIKVLK